MFAERRVDRRARLVQLVTIVYTSPSDKSDYTAIIETLLCDFKQKRFARGDGRNEGGRGWECLSGRGRSLSEASGLREQRRLAPGVGRVDTSSASIVSPGRGNEQFRLASRATGRMHLRQFEFKKKN